MKGFSRPRRTRDTTTRSRVAIISLRNIGPSRINLLEIMTKCGRVGLRPILRVAGVAWAKRDVGVALAETSKTISASGPEISDAIMQFKVWLLGLSPMVWRRVHVPADFTLRQLHV